MRLHEAQAADASLLLDVLVVGAAGHGEGDAAQAKAMSVPPWRERGLLMRRRSAVALDCSRSAKW